MAKIKKRGTTGNAKNFITRTQAVKKLQVSLADFRRLCIFKGIYPREPRNKKKANKGSTKPVTFYYTKDIQYLLHEPILGKFREHKTFAKKLNKAISKGEIGDAKRLDSNKPGYKLDHIIKERYPTFVDSLRDLDDALNMIFLFANMPATDKISTKVVDDCKKISNQWQAYVSQENLLTKVFVSIKGVYYSAKVQGQEVIWLSPFKFPQNIPSDIDFRIMLTFLEFYITLLNFVLFKLYKDSNLVYPPKINEENSKIFSGLSSYILELRNGANNSGSSENAVEDGKNVAAKTIDSSELSKVLSADDKNSKNKDEEKDEDDEGKLDEFESTNKKSFADKLYQPKNLVSNDQDPTKQLFKNMVFFVGREVNIEILEFAILSFNGKVVSEILLDTISNPAEKEKLLKQFNITHQINDRPAIKDKVPGRTYIQPQWIFDCINKEQLLSVSNYAPGETLPPHLSPWGDSGSYDPESKTAKQDAETEEDEEEEAEAEDNNEEEDEEEEEEVEADEDEEDEDLNAQKELELEAQGIKYSEAKSEDKSKSNKKRKHNNISKEEKEAQEEKEMKKIMMSNKQKKLYKKMEYSNKQKEDRKNQLTEKKRKIEKTKKSLSGKK